MTIWLVEIIVGLNDNWEEDRMPLSEVLGQLEAMAAVAAVDPPAAATEELSEARMCIICEVRCRVRGASRAPAATPCYARVACRTWWNGSMAPQVPDVRRRLLRAAGGGAWRARARGANVRAAKVSSGRGERM